ncbi:MAG TPA: FAD-binding oxidoreductase [Solirubrobacteraceae bacterium]|nr:FAD-binding oxidoreductase [Solirubrobacteraceae bacterium]
MTAPPHSARYVIVGAGVHGLSTAWHLARGLAARGEGSGEDVLVLDKTGVGAGASGIACGVVRNNYFQPAMSELMAACVEIWEAHAERLDYHGAGYVALGPPAQEGDLVEVYERQQRIGYRSELHVGEREVDAHMRALFPDWRAPGLSVCLHEHQGGFAFNLESVRGLAALASEQGVRILEGVVVTGFELDGSGAVTRVVTDQGAIAVEQVVVAGGPWIERLWEMLELPRRLDVHTPDGHVARDQEMWTYWYLQEGEVAIDPARFATAAGELPPVLHVDSAAPLRDEDGRLITDEPWGIYFKRDRRGVQGGASPVRQGHEFEIDPYPTATVAEDFSDMWSAALSHCMGRFAGARASFRDVRSGGVGAFTVDNFPVFDFMRPNAYVIADSNHGYKMIAVGREAARVLLGEHSSLLYPFRYERFATGDLHPVSNSPYPWS